MSLKFDYSGIFYNATQILLKRYSTRAGETSGGFEHEVENKVYPLSRTK